MFKFNFFKPLKTLIKRDVSWRPAKDEDYQKVKDAYARCHTHLRKNIPMLD